MCNCSGTTDARSNCAEKETRRLRVWACAPTSNENATLNPISPTAAVNYEGELDTDLYSQILLTCFYNIFIEKLLNSREIFLKCPLNERTEVPVNHLNYAQYAPEYSTCSRKGICPCIMFSYGTRRRYSFFFSNASTKILIMCCSLMTVRFEFTLDSLFPPF